MMKNITTDLSDFGIIEKQEVIRLLTAWIDQGLPYDFEEKEVCPMFNKNSGNVFLTNRNLEVAMMNGNDLESFYYCHHCGHEGFKEDCQLNDEGCNECNFMESES